MEEPKTNAGQGLGIAGLVLGIVAIPLAIMGCTSVLGLIIGATGIILSAVGLSQANKANGIKGLPIAGMVVSILGTAIALMWMLFIARFATEVPEFWRREGVHIMEEFEEEFGRELEESFEDIGEDMDQLGEDLEKTLQELEWENFDWEAYESGEPISDSEFSKMMLAYEALMEDYVELAEKSDQGDAILLAELTKLSAKAVAFAARLTAIRSNMSESQREEFEELRQKYEEKLEEVEEEN